MATYLAFRVASALVAWLPLSFGYRLAGWLGAIAYRFSSRQRDTLKANLRRALGPAATEARIDNAARGGFATWAKNYYDLLRIPRMPLPELERRVRLHGIERLHEALRDGRGLILVTAHFGSFESVAQILAALNYPLIVPAEPIEPERLFNFVNGLRSCHGLRFVRGERGVMRLLIKALRHNEIVGLAVDRNPAGDGLLVEYFGAQARVQPGAATLARREGCPVMAAFCVRRSDDTTDVFIEPPIPIQRTDDEAADTLANMRAMLTVIERYIRTYPE
ncbi:MAG: lysophospholipid acyltransferase family protein, partial [Chloroflexota bacterium]